MLHAISRSLRQVVTQTPKILSAQSHAWRHFSVAPLCLSRPNNLNPDCAINQQVMHATLKSRADGQGQAILHAEHAEAFKKKYQHLANSANHIQGGALATLHDLASCQAITSLKLAGDGMSINMTFTHAVPLEHTQQVSADAQVVHCGRRYAYVDSQLYRNGHLCGQAQLIFNVRPLESNKVSDEYYDDPNGGNLQYSQE